jgi:hypothetical protein
MKTSKKDSLNSLIDAAAGAHAIARHAADKFVWPASFTLEMQSGGIINAQWGAKTRTLALCCELAADFADLYDGYGTGDIP